MPIPTPYEDLLRDVLANGTHKDDRTGTGTTSVFGRQLRFDLSESFPLITTKRVHFKSVALELLWFLRGDSNVRWLQERGVKIWNEWADDNGDLGPVYGVQFRRHYAPNDEVVEVDVRLDDYADYERPSDALRDPIECDLNSDEAWAVEVLSRGKNTVYLIQLPSGFTAAISRPNWRALIASGRGFSSIDGYAISASDTGYRGQHVPTPYRQALRVMWENMLGRCYNPEHPSYKFYGGIGVTVSPIWHSFEMFVKTLSIVPGYHWWQRDHGGMHLDKDYYGSSVYSPATCIFVPGSINQGITPSGEAFQVRGKLFTSRGDWAKRTGSDAWYAGARWAVGKTYRGISADEVGTVPPSPGKRWRRKVVHDQIADVVESIRTNPEGRRHIVSAWSPADIPDMALPPCHAMMQFYVADGKLSCQLYQRSADLFIGVPFNIASYALLTLMVAQLTGLEPGEFVWTGGDCHIYDNHRVQVAEQLTREPYPYPTVSFARAVEDISDFQFEDIELNDYQHHPTIRGAVAV